jgi:hypothetical protein
MSAPRLACVVCGRTLAPAGPSYPVDSTMTGFRCGSCQLAARVAERLADEPRNRALLAP